jgi:hypothetical protein
MSYGKTIESEKKRGMTMRLSHLGLQLLYGKVGGVEVSVHVRAWSLAYTQSILATPEDTTPLSNISHFIPHLAYCPILCRRGHSILLVVLVYCRWNDRMRGYQGGSSILPNRGSFKAGSSLPRYLNIPLSEVYFLEKEEIQKEYEGTHDS